MHLRPPNSEQRRFPHISGKNRAAQENQNPGFHLKTSGIHSDPTFSSCMEGQGISIYTYIYIFNYAHTYTNVECVCVFVLPLCSNMYLF